MKWIVRYILILIPIWIVYYLINIGSDNSFVYLYGLIINVLSAPVSGLFAFAVRKKTSGPEVVMVLIALICIIFSFDGIMFIV